jgi:hypothetical protein
MVLVFIPSTIAGGMAFEKQERRPMGDGSTTNHPLPGLRVSWEEKGKSGVRPIR